MSFKRGIVSSCFLSCFVLFCFSEEDFSALNVLMPKHMSLLREPALGWVTVHPSHRVTRNSGETVTSLRRMTGKSESNLKWIF